MNIDQEKSIVESLPSIYPMMREEEEQAIWTVLKVLNCFEKSNSSNVPDINVGNKEIIKCGECKHFFWWTETDKYGQRTYRKCNITWRNTVADGDCMTMLGAVRRQTGEKHEGSKSKGSHDPADHRPDDPLHQEVSNGEQQSDSTVEEDAGA